MRRTAALLAVLLVACGPALKDPDPKPFVVRGPPRTPTTFEVGTVGAATFTWSIFNGSRDDVSLGYFPSVGGEVVLPPGAQADLVTPYEPQACVCTPLTWPIQKVPTWTTREGDLGRDYSALDTGWSLGIYGPP